MGAGSLFPLYELWGSNSNDQDWWQVTLSTETSCCRVSIFNIRGIIIAKHLTISENIANLGYLRGQIQVI